MLDIGSRMKEFYEFRSKSYLTRRIPVIIRIDGKAFHTYTRTFVKPYDLTLINVFHDTCKYLLKEIQGAKIVYHQSDEISILVTDYDKLNTDCWFGYNVQKICSVSASMITYIFNKLINESSLKNNIRYPAMFDSRVFNISKEDVINYFIWRQQDWIRNSINLYARKHFSDKQLYKKSSLDVRKMLENVGDDWNLLDSYLKNGRFFFGDNIYDEMMTYETGIMLFNHLF